MTRAATKNGPFVLEACPFVARLLSDMDQKSINPFMYGRVFFLFLLVARSDYDTSPRDWRN